MERKADEAVVAAREAEKVKAEQTINDLRQRLQACGVLNPHSQHTSQHTLSTHPLNTPPNPPSQPTLSTHLINPFHQPTPSTHPPKM